MAAERLFLVALAAACVTGPAWSQDRPPAAASGHHEAGVEHHLRRRLDEASAAYARTLAADPPRAPTAAELAIVRRFAPRLYTTPTEFFPLKDVAVVVHPVERLLAYHFFWEDDIDFPDDNDPCDHELMWVRYSADATSIERIWTYFHGRILEGGDAALRDAREHGMRPRVNVQWGKHGSMPASWEELPIRSDAGDIERQYLRTDGSITLEAYNRATYRKLHSEGRRLLEHPIAARLGWPRRFDADWSAFVDFARAVDVLALLDQKRLVAVSRWNSAVINQRFLTYNFRPKTEWPPASAAEPARMAPAAGLAQALALDDFQLPAKSVFGAAMPRYPNAWFYVEASLASSYDAAVALVAGEVRSAMNLREMRGPFSNPEESDADFRLEHLQPWEDAAHRAQQHSHAFHLRYYHSALARHNLERVTLPTPAGPRSFFRLAASVHYEVEHSNPNHPDVEVCPICGRTGDYRQVEGNLVEMVHDPLGLELLLDGTIRGDVVRFEDADQAEVRGIAPLRGHFLVQSLVFPGLNGDRNTLRLGVVVIAPRPKI